MRSADISPATDEERRRQFREARDGLYGANYNIDAALYLVRLALLTERQRQAAVTTAICRALASTNSPAG